MLHPWLRDLFLGKANVAQSGRDAHHREQHGDAQGHGYCHRHRDRERRARKPAAALADQAPTTSCNRHQRRPDHRGNDSNGRLDAIPGRDESRNHGIAGHGGGTGRGDMRPARRTGRGPQHELGGQEPTRPAQRQDRDEHESQRQECDSPGVRAQRRVMRDQPDGGTQRRLGGSDPGQGSEEPGTEQSDECGPHRGSNRRDPHRQAGGTGRQHRQASHRDRFGRHPMPIDPSRTGQLQRHCSQCERRVDIRGDDRRRVRIGCRRVVEVGSGAGHDNPSFVSSVGRCRGAGGCVALSRGHNDRAVGVSFHPPHISDGVTRCGWRRSATRRHLSVTRQRGEPAR